MNNKLWLASSICLRSVWSAFVILFFGACSQHESSSAEALLATFEVANGFTLELIAAEPLVMDPVDMEIDEDGRVYVVEMPGYPLDKSGTGRIVRISDSNGDGVLDTRQVFAEGLVLPNSIMRWKRGFLVTDAPHVFYLEDSNNDGVAERKDTVLTGFALSNPQHNLNSPVFGMDNWIYLAHEGAVGTTTYADLFGDPGKEIYFPDHPQSPRLKVNAGGRSVRFDPTHHRLEMTSSHSQFGHTFDAWGHHFEVVNWNHIYEEVIAQTYLERNPLLLVSDATQTLSDHGPASEVFPITQDPMNQLLTDVGVITSACGLTAYLGGTFPLEYDRTTFVAEPVSNLVHVDQLTDKGVTFVAQRKFDHSEFLASRDPKFRPVNLYVGPDGALYVVDYYRQIIEHPEWMSDEVIKSGELYNDSNKGRIYRVQAVGKPGADWIKGLTLGKEPVGSLVELLSHTNFWWRMNAQRLLLDHADTTVAATLRNVVQHGSSAVGRVHALWTLDGLGVLHAKELGIALRDVEAGVRENAIRLFEKHLTDFPKLTPALLNMVNDADPKVRFQLLCTLGSISSPEAKQVRSKLLLRDTQDPWVQIAALSASNLEPSSMLLETIDHFQEDPAQGSLTRRIAAMSVGLEDRHAVEALVVKATKSPFAPWASPLLHGLADGLGRSQGELGYDVLSNVASTFLTTNARTFRAGALHLMQTAHLQPSPALNTQLETAARLALDPSQPEDIRADMVDFLSLGQPTRHGDSLMSLLNPTVPLSVQVAVLRTLGNSATGLQDYLLAHWSSLTPGLREPAIGSFLHEEHNMMRLLVAVENGTIGSSEINWRRKVSLMQADEPAVREKARALFTQTDKIDETYRAALTMKGDAVKGQDVFQKNCSICHQIRGKDGIALGPDLGTVHNWSKEAIMSNILSPSQSISSGYDLWAVELRSGEKFEGIIHSETPGSITFRNSGMTDKTVSRQEIKVLQALGISAMPPGLAEQITVEQMGDLLAFLKMNK